jgi:hypothetical protein
VVHQLRAHDGVRPGQAALMATRARSGAIVGRRSIVSAQLVGVPEFNRVLATLEKQVMPTATARALNLVATKMRTGQVRSISEEMGVQQKVVRTRTKLTKATPKRQQALLEFRGRAFNLIEFKARQTKRGVTASPWGKRRLIPHAFIATMPQGGRIVVIRRKRGETRVPRLPIDAWLGPGIAKTAAAENMQRQRVQLMQDVYPKEVERQLELLVTQLLARQRRADFKARGGA